MPKQFYTERDIEDLAARGQFTLTMGEDVVLTALAFEKAERLGVKLIQPHQVPPAAPIRPYLAEPEQTKIAAISQPNAMQDDELRARIRQAVKAKLGDQIDDTLLETIITRVLNNIKVN